jgi:hypothetical protein
MVLLLAGLLLQGEADAGHERLRSYRSSGLLNFEMQMAAERLAGVALRPQRCPRGDLVADGDAE